MSISTRNGKPDWGSDTSELKKPILTTSPDPIQARVPNEETLTKGCYWGTCQGLWKGPSRILTRKGFYSQGV